MRFELTVHFFPKFIFYLVAKQACLIGQAVGLIGNHMATLATQFAHLRFNTLSQTVSLNGGQVFGKTLDLAREDQQRSIYLPIAAVI